MRTFLWKASWQHSEEALQAPPNQAMKPMPPQALVSLRKWTKKMCDPLLHDFEILGRHGLVPGR